MPVINGKNYKSFKHPMLEYIFFKKNPKGNTEIEIISFTLEDISIAYRELGIKEPASISNTILDLVSNCSKVCRQKNPYTAFGSEDG